MKRTIFILMLMLCWIITNATVYYVSNSGSDAANGTSEGTAWQNLSKVSATTFSAGDQILFKRGDTWYGTITVNGEGAVGNVITFGAYGSGANPIITGFTTVTAWTNLGSNIWESTNAVSTLSTLNMVSIGGVNTAMGREPDTGYYYYQTYSGNTSITSNNLNGTPNWTGAEVAFCNTPYTIKRQTITSQSGGTLTFAAIDYILYGNQRLIIQNDPRTLDTQNEWYYNPSTKKLRIYSTSQPTNVKVSTVETLLANSATDYLTITDIDFIGSNFRTITIGDADNVSILDCTISWNGADGIYGGYTYNYNTLIEGCTFEESNNVAIGLSPYFTNTTIRSNTVNKVMLHYGAGVKTVSGTNDASIGTGISAHGNGNLIELNNVSNTGYIGIKFRGNNTIVQKNFVTTFCLNLHDGGGIYSWNGPNTTYTGTKVLNNIVIGTHADGYSSDVDMDGCIYLDDYTNGVLIEGNTLMGSEFGIFLHEAHDIVCRENLIFRNDKQIRLYGSAITFYMEDITVRSNQLFAKNTGQLAMHLDPAELILPTFISDSNYIARPINDTNPIVGYRRTPSFLGTSYTLATWRTYSGEDANSMVSPYIVTNADELYVAYNPTNTTANITLTAAYKDISGTTYTGGSISLPAYGSKMLFYTGEISGEGDDHPIITSFSIPATSDTLYVPITTFTATDDNSVTHYALTESSTPPAIDSPVWVVSAPTSYTFTNYGVRTLYAWVKDDADQISSPVSDQVNIYQQYLIPNKQPNKNNRTGEIYLIHNTR